MNTAARLNTMRAALCAEMRAMVGQGYMTKDDAREAILGVHEDLSAVDLQEMFYAWFDREASRQERKEWPAEARELIRY